MLQALPMSIGYDCAAELSAHSALSSSGDPAVSGAVWQPSGSDHHREPALTEAKKDRPGKPARNLKVFQTQLGFYDIVVAAPSRAAALRAWGTHRDLFSDKQAQEATDEPAIAAARAQPGVALRRAVGTTDAFGLDPGLPRLPDMPQLSAKVSKPKPKPDPPDRSRLKAAEEALRVLTELRHAEEREFTKRRAALDTEEADAKRRHAAALSAAATSVEREQRAYTKAGGRDR